MIDRGRQRKARGRRLFRFPSRHCCRSSLLPPLARFCFPLRLLKLVIVSVYMRESERQRRDYWFGKSVILRTHSSPFLTPLRAHSPEAHKQSLSSHPSPAMARNYQAWNFQLQGCPHGGRATKRLHSSRRTDLPI